MPRAHRRTLTVCYTDVTWCTADEPLTGSFIPQASLSEGFFLLLYSTLSVRVLLIKCFYFSIVYLANRLVGGFLPLCSTRRCWRTAVVFLSTVLLKRQLCFAGLQLFSPSGGFLPCATIVTQTETLNLGLGQTELVGAEPGASQWNSTRLEWNFVPSARLVLRPVQQIPLSSLVLKPFKTMFSKASELTVVSFSFIWNFSCAQNPKWQEDPFSSAKRLNSWGSLQVAWDSWDREVIIHLIFKAM